MAKKPEKTKNEEKVAAEYRIPIRIKIEIGVLAARRRVAASHIVEQFLSDGLQSASKRSAKAASN